MSAAGEWSLVFVVAMLFATTSTLLGPMAALLDALTPDALLEGRPAARHMAGVAITTILSVGVLWLMRYAAHSFLKGRFA